MCSYARTTHTNSAMSSQRGNNANLLQLHAGYITACPTWIHHVAGLETQVLCWMTLIDTNQPTAAAKQNSDERWMPALTACEGGDELLVQRWLGEVDVGGFPAEIGREGVAAVDPGGGCPPPPPPSIRRSPPPLWIQGEGGTVVVDPGAGRPPPWWIQGEGGRRGGCGRHGRGGGEVGADGDGTSGSGS
uniref:Uncharacterized protein n=1 Tax=Triticum urartu TaxID=4572 RepID=A0A8R7U4Y0_TRIUA